MAVWSTVHFSEASANWRFDAEYWKPEFLRNEEYILSSKDKKGLLVSNVYGLVRRIKGSAFYPSFVENYSDRGMPFLRVADIGNLFVSDDQMVRIESDIVHQYRQIAVVSEGDLVLSKGGSIGEVAVVQEGLGKCALCRDVIAAELDEAKVSPYYLAAFLKSRFGQLQLDRNKSQAVQPHLTFPAVGVSDAGAERGLSRARQENARGSKPAGAIVSFVRAGAVGVFSADV